MAFYETLKLEKGMYSAPGKSFTQTLEELDSSENYRGTPLEGLDAYQRQLKRFQIHVSTSGDGTGRRIAKCGGYCDKYHRHGLPNLDLRAIG